NKQAIEIQQTKQAWQAKVDQEHEELKSTLTEGMKAVLESEIKASNADLGRIKKFIDETSGELGELNRKMDDYRIMQKKEVTLRDKIDRVEEQVRELTRFSL